MISLIFDTETTGLVNPKLPLDDQPHPVQLACELVNDKKTVSLMSIIINSGIESHPKALETHNITLEYAKTFGFSPKAAAGLFINYLIRCDRIVAHNIDFDLIICEAMIQRSGVDFNLDTFRKIPRVCTMLSTKNLLKLPGKYGYKWPRLDEAYRHFVDPNGFEGAHDAMADVKACKKVLWALEDKGHELVGGKR